MNAVQNHPRGHRAHQAIECAPARSAWARRGLVTAIATMLLVAMAHANEPPNVDALEGAGRTTFTGAVTDDLFVGIATAAHPEDPERRALMVYLCDGEEVSVWTADEVTGRESTLVTGDASITMTVNADEVTGTVTLADAPPQPFAAPRATGDAGLYRAVRSIEGLDYVGGWIILNDGRQLGAVTVDGAVVDNPPLDLATGEATIEGGTLTPSAMFFCPPWPLEYCRFHR